MIPTDHHKMSIVPCFLRRFHVVTLLLVLSFPVDRANGYLPGVVFSSRQELVALSACNLPRRTVSTTTYDQWPCGGRSTVVLNLQTNDENSDDQPSSLEGKDLARKFYEFQKGQEATQEPIKSQPTGDSTTSDGTTTTNANVRPGQRQDASDVRPIKFTGQQRSLFSEPETRTSSRLSREQGRKFNLAGTFERTLPIQAGVVALSLAFVLYIGFTGGITSGIGGIDEYMDDDEADDIWELQRRDSIMRQLGTEQDEEGLSYYGGSNKNGYLQNPGRDDQSAERSSSGSVWL